MRSYQIGTNVYRSEVVLYIAKSRDTTNKNKTIRAKVRLVAISEYLVQT